MIDYDLPEPFEDLDGHVAEWLNHREWMQEQERERLFDHGGDAKKARCRRCGTVGHLDASGWCIDLAVCYRAEQEARESS